MVISGTKTKIIASETIPDTCTFCGGTNCVDILVSQRYSHVFWIPFFPLGKVASSKCNHCKHVLEGDELPDNFNQVYLRLKLEKKAPIWMFSGLFLVVLLIAFGIYSGNKNDEKNQALIVDPKIGDIYHISTSNHQYTLARVNGVKGDTVYLLWSNFETDKITGLSDILAKGNEAFSDIAEPFTLSELKGKLDKDEIIDIER
jgi:hypothetical protein